MKMHGFGHPCHVTGISGDKNMSIKADKCTIWEDANSPVHELAEYDPVIIVKKDANMMTYYLLKAKDRNVPAEITTTQPTDWPVLASKNGEIIFDGEVMDRNPKTRMDGKYQVFKAIGEFNEP
jgi:hypothetical protein